MLNAKEWYWCEKCNEWMPHTTLQCRHLDGTSLQRPDYTQNDDNASSSTSSYLAVTPSYTDNRS